MGMRVDCPEVEFACQQEDYRSGGSQPGVSASLALQRLNRGLGEDAPFLGHLGFQGLEALLEVGEVIA